MQTFLPYPAFDKCAEVLDRQRLGKQRVEAMQIIRTLLGETHGWTRHPAVLMWAEYIGALKVYYNCMLFEWARRGYQNIKLQPVVQDCFLVPRWLGNEALHASHRAALLAKNPEWYGQFEWTEKPEINYIWPGRKHEGRRHRLHEDQPQLRR